MAFAISSRSDLKTLQNNSTGHILNSLSQSVEFQMHFIPANWLDNKLPKCRDKSNGSDTKANLCSIATFLSEHGIHGFVLLEFSHTVNFD
jgi:hypothetical protein